MQKDASFSEDRIYRFVLTRVWGESPHVLFVCLNPSTADESNDDATVRRCIGFAKYWGYGGMLLCNLFAFRATDPGMLHLGMDPVGRGNDLVIKAARQKVGLAVAAWGSRGARWPDRCQGVLEIIAPAHCLGFTKSGQPLHPLYQPMTSPLMLVK